MASIKTGAMVWVSPGRAPRLAAAAALLMMCEGASGQASPPAAPAPSVAVPDPGTDLAPMPDLGVDWPDPAAIDAVAPGLEPGGSGPTAETLQRYQVRLEGAEALGDTFRTRFNDLSALVANDNKPANAAQLDRRVRDDEQLVRELLNAAGRYDARIGTTVRTESGTTIVRIRIDPRDAFTFGSVTLPGLEMAGAGAGAGGAALRRQFPVNQGDRVDADAVLAATASFRTALGREGYPFAKVGEPQVAIDHDTNIATLTLPVTLGARSRFGRIVPIGPRPIFTEAHLDEIARFHAGDEYDAARLEDFRRALIATGLVSTATITPVATGDPGVVDVQVRIDRAPPRTIAGELGYGTGEGGRAEVSWQHRNLIKPEGAVTFRGVLGTREQALGAVLRRGNYGARDRILNAQIVASHSNFDAYDARTFTLGASLERQTNIIWQKTWSWSAGAELVASDERDTIRATGTSRRRTFLVAALPTTLAYDGTDDLLNPTRGHRISVRVSPEASLQGAADAYLKLQFDASGYLPIGQRVVLAGRTRLGSIQGVAREDIAPSRRFYAGGGGSVRGYGYQQIGPLDVDGDPVGGRSLTEFAAEARIRFGSFGVVPFLDAGNLYSSTVPRFGGLRYGAGIGVRYYSSFGPIRVDVGTPLDRRNGESRVAVYVSLGQAF
ncbi:BamA/TamA family outer membrane protein [uncultured Sphingomonas sp.]|uniref:autotransporter assembly complex protein TamA n=1 Tax=uncultured Sphingomonas sp. TaxID=158754 RepID=UPI0025DC8CD5|nr:BamA/TamA family outer membrane protein [uncultured Sphingomonas sp.]